MTMSQTKELVLGGGKGRQTRPVSKDNQEVEIFNHFEVSGNLTFSKSDIL